MTFTLDKQVWISLELGGELLSDVPFYSICIKHNMLLNEHQGTQCSIFTIQGIVVSYLYKIDCIEAKTDPGGMDAPLLDFFLWVGCVFVNFKCIFFNCGQHAMCTICIIFSIRSHYNNIQGMYEGHQNNPQTPRILSRQDRAPWFWNS